MPISPKAKQYSDIEARRMAEVAFRIIGRNKFVDLTEVQALVIPEELRVRQLEKLLEFASSAKSADELLEVADIRRSSQWPAHR